MKIIFSVILVLCFVNQSFSQEKDLTKIADSISTEGHLLYKSEWTSWYGSDIFTEKCKSRLALAGGYISYDSGHGMNNIFFSKGDNPSVLATISFGYEFNSANYKLDTISRKLTAPELELYTIRQTAIEDIKRDTLVKSYRNTSLSPIPMIINKLKRVYVLTGPHVSGFVILGNDYLLTFDQKNNIISKKKLHNNIIVINTKKAATDSTKTDIASVHLHLPNTGDFITATDICTLMLYEKFTTWNQHIVMSKNYISIWNCKMDNLLILTTKAWEKIYGIKSTLENPSN